MTKNLPSKPESVAKKRVFTGCHQCQNIVYFCLQFFYDRSDLATADLCVWGVGLVDYFLGGRGGGAKENVLRFQVPVVQWVDSTTHWINLCLCPVDNAIIVSLILIYWLVPSIFFNNRGHISRVWRIKVGLNKIIDQQSTWSFLWGLLEWSRCSYFVIMS